ncbi:MAG: pyruvate kinase [Acidimicrobiia bacterium]
MPITTLVRRRTKIVATLGPASESELVIETLVEAGADVFRMNMSHGEHDWHRGIYENVRRVAARRQAPVAVLADLCGPKIRVGRFAKGGIDLVEGQRITVTTRDVMGAPGLVPSQYEGFARDVQVGCRVLLADGLYELRVDGIDASEVGCTVVRGGRLTDRKGINLPDVEVSAPCLTPKDRADVELALDLGVDLLALSFVRRASDVEELQELLRAGRHSARVIAKIEKPEALANIEEILDVADGIMVARGDLGVELPVERVPVAQRDLIAKARRRRKPSIVATQMLESMIEHSVPTRAEVSDVATAVFSGADAIMLSAETAVGSYPGAAVTMMDRVARQAEADQFFAGRFASAQPDGEELDTREAVARAIAQLSRDLMVRAIVVFSAGGATAEVVAGLRPAAPILAITTDDAVWRQMNLLWGVVPLLVDPCRADDQHETARQIATELGLAAAGQHLLVLAGLGDGANPPSISVVDV